MPPVESQETHHGGYSLHVGEGWGYTSISPDYKRSGGENQQKIAGIDLRARCYLVLYAFVPHRFTLERVWDAGIGV